jgi:predicted  nucleic acid-binding Zn-ribbon protein
MTANPMTMLRRGRGLFVVVLFLCVAAYGASLMLQKRSLVSQQAQAVTQSHTEVNAFAAQLGKEQLAKSPGAAVVTKLDAHVPGPPVIAMRLWTVGGTLRYSSLDKDASPPVMELLKASTKGLGHAATSVQGNVMTTYVPLHEGKDKAPFGAVEIQQSYSPVEAAAAKPWSTVRTGAVALVVLMLIALLLGFVGGLPWRRAAKAGSGFVSKGEGPDPLPAAANEEQARLRQEMAQADTERDAATQELAKLKDQVQATNQRAGARIEELQGELERVNQKLKDAQVASATAARSADPSLTARIAELEQMLQAEQLRNAEAETRAHDLKSEVARLASEADREAGEERTSALRVLELEAALEQTDLRLHDAKTDVEHLRAKLEDVAATPPAPDLQPDIDRLTADVDRLQNELVDAQRHVERLDGELGSALERAREAEVAQLMAESTPAPEEGPDLQPEVDRLHAEAADLRTHVERLDAELGSALERAREAEDIAAALQDHVNAVVSPNGTLAAPEPELELDPTNPLDVWAARQPEVDPDLDDDEAETGDLRSRLARAAARKKGHNFGDPDWP